MSTEKLTRKKDDTGPPVDDTLETNGSGDDISGATVAFSMWPVGRKDSPKIDENTANVTTETASSGEVEYAFASGDLDSTGDFLYEWKVTFSNGEIRKYPNHRAGNPLEIIE